MSVRRNIVTFYTLILTQTFSLIGSRMSGLAIGFWLFAQTGDATPLTLVSFFSFLPRLVSAGFAGVFADRYDRRYVMALADGGQAIGTLFLFVSFASDGFQLWHLYAVTFIQAIFDMFQSPAFMASVTMLVPDEHRSRANAIQMFAFPLAGIIALAVAGALYAPLGVTGIIAIDLFTFFVSLAVVLSVHIPRPPQTEEGGARRGSMWRESFEGLRFVWARKPLLMVFVFTACTNLFLAGMATLNMPYILTRTGSEAAFSAVMAIFSIGSIVGTVLMAVWKGPRSRVTTMMPGMAITGLAVALHGIQSHPIGMAVALFIWALFPPMNNVSIISLLQVKVPPDLQGRVFAAIQQISMLLIPLSYAVVGPLADNVFEPAVNTPVWDTFAPLVGHGAGAGMGLMMVISGLAITVVAISIYSISWVRTLETSVPDYVASAA